MLPPDPDRGKDHNAASFKRADAGSYDDVAHQFDQLTDEYSAPLAEHLIACAHLVPGERVLDVGTGTGVVLLRAAQRVQPGGSACGMDLSVGMLQLLRAKSRGIGVDLCRMDAETLGFTARSFDVVVSLFALMHFPDPLSALGQLHSVLLPGGRLVVGVGSGPPLLSLSGLLHRLGRVPELVAAARGKHLIAPGFLNRLVERHIPARGGDAEESALARSHHHPASAVPALVRDAGFIDVQTSWCGHTATIASPEEFWTLQATFSSIARKRLAGAAVTTVDSVRAEFFRECSAVQQRGGRLLFPQATLIVTARRPG